MPTCPDMRVAPWSRYAGVHVRAWSCVSAAGDAAATWAAVRDGVGHLVDGPGGPWGRCRPAGGLLDLAATAAAPLLPALDADETWPALGAAASKGDISRLEAEGGPAVTRAWPDACTPALARRLGLARHLPVAVVAACSTGLATILAGADAMAAGTTRCALVGAVDRSCSPLVLAGFRALGVLSDDPRRPGSGFAPAEGAGFLALGSDGPWRLVAGVRLGEAAHETACGDATVLTAGCAALWEALPDPDLIVVHGTNTVSGEACESQALGAGPWAETPRLACKPSIGHCLGASSAVELAAALEAPVRRLWKLGLGFGGHVVLAALERV